MTVHAPLPTALARDPAAQKRSDEMSAPPDSRARRVRQLLARRTLTGAITLTVVSLGVFALAAVSPMDPLTAHLGAGYQSATIGQRDAARAAFGLDQPWWQSWLNWWAGLAHADLGFSTTQHQPVSMVIAERLPFTLGLTAAALSAAVVISLLAGTWAGLRVGRTPDTAVSGTATVLAATPPFVLSLLLVAVMAVGWGLFPTSGAARPGHEVGGTDLLWHDGVAGLQYKSRGLSLVISLP